jgi:hypothetical protein
MYKYPFALRSPLHSLENSPQSYPKMSIRRTNKVLLPRVPEMLVEVAKQRRNVYRNKTWTKKEAR